jgi:hypothetical protein
LRNFNTGFGFWQDNFYFNTKNENDMRTIQLNIPDSVDLKDYDFSMIIAAKLYEDAKLSSGQAAQIVGLIKKSIH